MTMLEMEVMDRTGHSQNMWDTEKPDEVAAARALYDSLTKKGYRAFRVKKDGSEGERMERFDPDAGKMIMVPALQGG